MSHTRNPAAISLGGKLSKTCGADKLLDLDQDNSRKAAGTLSRGLPGF
jgi:hypothetical protein